jgi:hypothetical protein
MAEHRAPSPAALTQAVALAGRGKAWLRRRSGGSAGRSRTGIGLVMAALIGLGPAAGAAQAVPDSFAFGEFEIGLSVVSFDRKDIVRVEMFRVNGLDALTIQLAPDLDAAFAEATRGKAGYESILRICGKTVMYSRLETELTVAALLFPSRDPKVVQAAFELFKNPPCAEL